MNGSSSAGGDAPDVVEYRSIGLFEQAQSILGDRLAYFRRDPDRGVRITVIDLDDDDLVVLREAASRLGIAEWTRIERADPTDVHSWEALRRDLSTLRDERPEVLRAYPDLQPVYQRPPVRIELNASDAAVAAAAELHDRHGDFVALRVGALPYPCDPGRNDTSRPWTVEPRRDLVDAAEMVIALDGSLSIHRGQSATHAVVVHNIGERPITLNTNGNLTAVIVDPATAEPVGGFTGPQIMPLITFAAGPGQTVRIPLLVATASYRSELGFSIPAGVWQLIAPLDLQDGRHLPTSPMDFAITD